MLIGLPIILIHVSHSAIFILAVYLYVYVHVLYMYIKSHLHVYLICELPHDPLPPAHSTCSTRGANNSVLIYLTLFALLWTLVLFSLDLKCDSQDA